MTMTVDSGQWTVLSSLPGKNFYLLFSVSFSLFPEFPIFVKNVVFNFSSHLFVF